MIGSLWRYSHFLLALISALFLIVASVTGAILALEPITKISKAFAIVDLEKVYLSEALTVVKKSYAEVLEIEITPENFVKVSVFTEEGNSETIYIHPISGHKLGDVQAQSPFFSFVTNLHRSLFLKGIGRGIVGIVSLLLCFIAVTGVFLLAQRQGGFKKWFTKVQETNLAQRYHVILSRWLLLPLLVLAVTGVYLSAEKFSFLPNKDIEHNWDVTPAEILNDETTTDVELFKNVTLSQVRKLTFPFSEDPEDYFQLALRDKELLVQQHTGALISEVQYPFVLLASRLSLKLHTGQGSVLWSAILLVASLSLLFFMFSGFAMSLKRRKKTKIIKQQWHKDEADYILLVGSETGSTYDFAKTFYNELKRTGKKVYISTLNEYTTYEKASHLIVFTATYGDGDAPSNASKFHTLFSTIKPSRSMQFSVLGFGSLLYPHYCYFAIKVDALLHSHSSFKPINPLVKIDDQSSHIAFLDWVKKWNQRTNMNLKVTPARQKSKTKKEQSFKVIQRSSLNIDNTAIIRLRPKKKMKFQSGDLINITPLEDTHARQYSIAKVNDDILLSVKLHPNGVCSTYLCNLKEGDSIKASVVKNVKFHFPKKAPSVWLVANGTGMAPYLGMLYGNHKVPVRLTWGGRTEASFDCYREILESSLSQKQIESFEIALSQTDTKRYVQDVLSQQQFEIGIALKNGGVFMICGSMAMQQGVISALEEITATQLQQPLSDFENNGQLLMDCY